VSEARASEATGLGEIVVHRPPRGRRRRADALGAWRVTGRPAERAVSFSDLTDEGAMAEAVIRLRRLGVDRALARPARATAKR